MEQMRTDKLKKSVIMIQKYMIGNSSCIYYKELRKRVIDIQQRFRAKLELKRLRREKHEGSATKVQKTWKMYKARKQYRAERQKVIKCQACNALDFTCSLYI